MMNLLTVGVDEADMAIAAIRVAELGGGIVVAVDGKVLAEVALPIYGILSDRPSSRDRRRLRGARRAGGFEAMGCTFEGLLSSAGFACLAVSIPSLKITSRGLARVTRSARPKRSSSSSRVGDLFASALTTGVRADACARRIPGRADQFRAGAVDERTISDTGRVTVMGD